MPASELYGRWHLLQAQSERQGGQAIGRVAIVTPVCCEEPRLGVCDPFSLGHSSLGKATVEEKPGWSSSGFPLSRSTRAPGVQGPPGDVKHPLGQRCCGIGSHYLTPLLMLEENIRTVTLCPDRQQEQAVRPGKPAWAPGPDGAVFP